MKRFVWFCIGFAAILAIAVLAGCTKANVKPPPAPEVIQMPSTRYVPIDAKYLARCSWVADGAILEIFDVARGRKKCLEYYETQFDAIGQIQGAPAP